MDSAIAFLTHMVFHNRAVSPDMSQHPAHKKFICLWSVNRSLVLVLLPLQTKALQAFRSRSVCLCVWESRSKFRDGGGDVLQGGSRLGGGESLDGLQSLVAMVTA